MPAKKTTPKKKPSGVASMLRAVTNVFSTKKSAPKKSSSPAKKSVTKKPVAKKMVTKTVKKVAPKAKPAAKKVATKKVVAKMPTRVVPKKVAKKVFSASKVKSKKSKVSPKTTLKKVVKAAVKKIAPKAVTKKLAVKQPIANVASKKSIAKPTPTPQKTVAIVQPVQPVESGEMPKTYLPYDIEPRVRQTWEDREIGKATGKGAPWVMMLPPPNVTGALHLGHALTVTIEDIMARYQRMNGRDVLWLPGTDHAGIATQNVVERRLKEQGVKRHDIGREAFIEKVWQWKHEYHARITDQIKKMGASIDWSRERFTLDDGYKAAVNHTFVKLYEKGLIYRDKKLVNWCPRCESVLSDIEVDHIEEEGRLYFIRYFVNATDKSICVATTRPETMLGDVAIAVHPDDPRYKEYVGKKVILPIANRLIPIIADARVDPKFGTGAVKITPAHDPLDAEIGRDHKLASIVVIGPQGKMTKHAGRFKGMALADARSSVVRYLDDIGNLEKITKHLHQVGHCSRCRSVIEPLESLQWFVKMKPLADKAMKAVAKKEIRFIPDRFEGEFTHWMEDIHDWCISRQLWWGHQIPVWYCKKVAEWPKGNRTKKTEGCMQTIVSEAQPEACPHCGNLALERDPDVLDTWFSSGLWPFATLGWPKKTADFTKYFPNAMLETGRDIIFFWVARMITMGLELTGKVPFKEVYMHGLVRDEAGKKMSKSIGNVVDPLEMIERYGTDALRMSLVIGTTPGLDIKFGEAKITGQRNFINKLWNASRFVFGKLGKDLEIPTDPRAKTLADRWILSRLNTLITDVNDAMGKHAYAEAAAKIEDFTWHEFCDWYLELSKDEPHTKVLAHVLATILTLAHPFIPFVTEALFAYFWIGAKKTPLLALTKWPKANRVAINAKTEDEMKVMLTVIGAIRTTRSEMNVEPAKKIAAIIYAGAHEAELKKNANEIKKLARLSVLTIKKTGAKIENAIATFEGGLEIYLPVDKLLDPKEEKKRLAAEKAEAEQYRAVITTRLDNKDFVARAPKNIVEQERDKLNDVEARIAKINERMKILK